MTAAVGKTVGAVGPMWSLLGALLFAGLAWLVVAPIWPYAAAVAGLVVVTVWRWRRSAFSRLRRENQGDGWADRSTVRQAGSRVAADSPQGGSGTLLGHTVVGSTGKSVHAPHRGTIGVVGGPGSGKTLELARIARRHPGGAVISSSRLDLHDATVAARTRLGPVSLFNPEGLDGRESTFRWSPLTGCADPRVAAERAAALVGATDSGSADDQTWLQSASKVLRCLMMAAALTGRDMRDVHRWSATWAQDVTPLAILGHPIALELSDVKAHLGAPEGWADELAAEIRSAAEKAAASVMRAVSLAVEFMSDESVARSCCPQPGEATLDVVDLIEKRGTLYLVGSERKFSPVTPLLAALTTHVFDTARYHASTKPRGRLAPALLLELDEVRVTASVPLDVWTSYAGGHGIHIVWASQDFAQLRERWNDNGAATIGDNTTHLLVFGGLSCHSDLEGLSVLCGEQRVKVAGEDGKTERERVMPADRIAQLPTFHALLLSRSKPVILRTAGVPRIAPKWVAAKALGAWLIEKTPIQAPVAQEQEKPTLTLIQGEKTDDEEKVA